MKNPDAQVGKGTLPGYLSAKEAANFAHRLIGLKRPLSVAEEADMLAAGKTREEIADMTPESLRELADSAVNQSTIFLGS